MATQRDRAALQNLFQQGAKPTGDDFADLIQSALNIVDDGIAPGSTTDDPPVIAARGTRERFLDLDVDGTNAWQLEHLPLADDAGLSFSYNDQPALFLEAGSGKVGIGTTAPSATLTVSGEIRSENGTDSLSLCHDGSNAVIAGTGTGRLELGMGASRPLSVTDADVRVGTTTDHLLLRHDGANATLEAAGAGQLNVRHGDATRLYLSDDKVGIIHNLDITGDITTNQATPFLFKRFTNMTDCWTGGFDTSLSTTDYAAAITGFYMDVSENGYGPSMAYMAEKNGTWHVFADVHGTSDACSVDVMFVRREISERPETWNKLH